MKFTRGDHVKIVFPDDHQNANMNGMTGKVVSFLGDGSNLVFMDTLWGSIGFADERLVKTHRG